MKIPAIFRPSRSIATRLSWRIVITLLLMSLLLAAFVFFVTWTIGIVGLSLLFWSRMEVAEEKINNVFSSVEIAVSNNVPEIKESIEKNGYEYFGQERLLQFNSNIMGAAIALNPQFGPKKGQMYASYAYRDSTGIHEKMLDSKEYDYLNKEWFSKPIETGKGIWTEPYVDLGGGNIMMTTYSLPLLNKNNDIYAVSTADLSLDWLATLALELDSINNEDFYLGFYDDNKCETKTFIVTSAGTLVVHPDKKGKQGTSLSDYFKEQKCKDPDRLINTILSNSQSMTAYVDGSKNNFFLFYVPIERTGWVAVTIVPFSDLLPPIYVLICFFLVVLAIGLIIIALICRINIHKITRPLSLFAKSAEEIAKGNLNTPLPVIKTKDEMRTLHDSFQTMQHSLISQIDEIKKVNEEKGRIEGELYIARNIQMSMLPKQFPAFPDRTDIDIYAYLRPAKEVGGDLYDYLIRNEKLYFCVGDVAGKGIPASMLMAVARALFRTASSHESNPGKIVSGINELIVEDNDSNMFVTLFVGVLDLPTGRLRYCNAGHNMPLLVSQSEVKLLPCDSNLPLGVMDDWKFTTQKAIIRPQTTIFLYTDGLTEAENKNKDQFKEERVSEVARNNWQNPQTLVEQVEMAVHAFTGGAEQNDDLTMLAVLYKKQKEQNIILSRSITLANDVEQVPLLSAFVEEVCEEAKLDASSIMNINLAMEEAVVNVMDYAYAIETEGDIIVEAKVSKEQLKFIITDWGMPFDPTTREDIDTTTPAEERSIGGLGIHLVRQIMDIINYERIDGKNVLTLTKKLT